MPLDLLTRLDPLRRVRCPFCFERFAAYEMHFRCNDHYCKHDSAKMVDDPILSKAIHGRSIQGGATMRTSWWVDPDRDPRRGLRRWFDWLLLPGSATCPNCKTATDYHLCPCCHEHLPEAAITLNPGHIAIFGPQSVGKSTYVTVLIHELDHRVGPERRFVLDPISDEVRDRYEREYQAPIYGGGGFGVGEELNGEVERRGQSATPGIQDNRAILKPLVYRLTRRKGKGRADSLISFFDNAGEDWEMNIELLRQEAAYLREARGLLFLVDPLRIRPVALDRRIKLTEKESRVPSADYLSDARKLAGFFKRTPVKTPLAICLNKLDRWGRLLEPGTLLHDLATSVPGQFPIDAGTDQTIHEEVQSALRRWGAVGFLEYLDRYFPNHRFFACSSLGDAAPDRDDAAQPLPTPLLVERAVLWLMEKQGMIPAA